MIKTNKKKINSLYIHIPFCKNICPYCDFVKFYSNKSWENQYINRLIEDLDEVKKKFKKFKTIYIGGGTPSILSRENLINLLDNLKDLRRKKCEFTIEANPEDINDEFLRIIKKYKVNRISIGIQSFNKNILKEIKRDYSIDYFELINKVKKYIKNINIDLIYGFKGQTLEDLNKDLDCFIKLNVNHISIYSLIVDEGSIFYVKKYSEQDEDSSRKFYDFILDKLRKNGYERYEISNFARKKKYQSKHNLNYRKNKEYVGIGLASHGYIGPYRYNFTKSLSNYLNKTNLIEKEEVNSKTMKEYFFLTNLRLKDGFKLKDYKKTFKSDFIDDYKTLIDELVKDNLAKITKKKFYLTDDGLIILDFILIKIFNF